jgi:large subunit ribosomal protein L28
MARKCELTGRVAMTGNNVSHSQRHTKRKWQLNLVNVTLTDANGRKRKLRVAASALRTLNKDARSS